MKALAAIDRHVGLPRAEAVSGLSCGTELFPLPANELRALVLWAQEPVHPDVARRCGPVHGPQPAMCVMDPHPGSPWHWDGRGTWWSR
jgi:hypothetical protein